MGISMEFPLHFISATRDFCTIAHHVPAPYLRKSFVLKESPQKAELLICGLGFYELFVNGERITRGALAPFINNPDGVLYYDKYDLAGFLCPGENVLGVQLGNGMQNSVGGVGWGFDRARYHSSPKVTLRMEAAFADGPAFVLESDESFCTAPSPILFDDLRCGEHYDARREICDWCAPGFDDAGWTPALPADTPRGDTVLCGAEPIVVEREVIPVAITKEDDGYVYDFGVCCAGVCRLSVDGRQGQSITLTHGDWLKDGRFFLKNIQSEPDGFFQTDVYTCKGGGESWVPRFTYHGFQYVKVEGITPEQATPELLTFLVMHSGLAERGGFSCSDKTANRLQQLTRRSTLANFFYFPTDCPHREKNGWTGDVALSAEHTLLNLAPENSYREWLHSLRAAQTDEGLLPCAVPTGDKGGWGYNWGYGPAWDCALVELPFQLYVYRGDTQVVRENATAIFRYVDFLSRQVRPDGLVEMGLGDWCPPGRLADRYKSPLKLTDSIYSMDICRKAAFLFSVLGQERRRAFAESIGSALRRAIRQQLIDDCTMTAAGSCQTSQAMALYYGVFEPGEKPEAFKRLMEMIERTGGHIDTGVLGGRVIFHVLTAFGESDLAFSMITRPDFPSYGHWVARGANALWEDFLPDSLQINSRCHHFWGDISSWFIKCVAGIRLNPRFTDVNELLIAPSFVSALNHSRGFHIAPAGRVESAWKRVDDGVELTVKAPETMKGVIRLPQGYVFEDGLCEKTLASGDFQVQKT